MPAEPGSRTIPPEVPQPGESLAASASTTDRSPRQEFLVFGAPLIGEEEIAEVVDTLRSGWIGFGPKSLRLEADFARYARSTQAVSVNSCTAGLHLALIAAGIRPGDEVITTPLTFVASANVIEHAGATPVFVDVDLRTQNIDPERIAAAMSPRTRAVLPVHMAGRPCDMDAIGALAEQHGLTVIEDAAHATEAAWRGRKIGSISRFTAFSFYATKNLTTAEGGMVTTNDAAAADRMRILRLHGIDKDAWKRYSGDGSESYDMVEPGFKYNMTDLQASLGLHQLARLERNLTIRERHWRTYDEAFASVPAIETPAPDRPEERHARHLYTILLDPDRLAIDRRRFIGELRARRIGSGIHFRPVHLQSYYREKYRLGPGSFPNAERIGSRTVSLPLSAKLSDDDVRDVIAAVREIVDRHST